MKILKLGVCFLDEDDNLISKRMVNANWTVDLEQDLKGLFDVYFLDEIAAILTEHLKLTLTEDTVKDMLNEIKDKK